jgi:hypoxanthine phosphoribosyltransferase
MATARDLSLTGTAELRTVIRAEQIQKRVREMGRQIADHYQGRKLHVLGVLENSFVFTSDLIRAIEGPVLCHFIKPRYSQKEHGPAKVEEIYFSHELDLRGQNVLIVEGVIHSGVTDEFLMADFRSRGAASVKLATLLDRQAARRVALQPDYFGFLVDDHYFVGYGMGSQDQLYRNLPYIAAQV